MKQLYEQENILLGRKRYAFEIEHVGSATPKKQELKEQLAKKLGVDASKISICHVYTNYGSNVSKAIIHVYEDEKLLTFLEIPKGKKAKAPSAK